MPKINTADTRLGFWIAFGFFLFGLATSILMYLVRRARHAAHG